MVMTLYNQPEAFASDLGDDQLRYLFHFVHLYSCKTVFGVAGSQHNMQSGDDDG